MKFKQKELLYGAGLLLTGLLFGWLLFSGSGNESYSENLSEKEMEQHVQDTHTNEEGEIIYTCSMHPQIRENEPGNCPICGMELIPAGGSDAEIEQDDYSMIMTASAAKLAKVQTTPVVRSVPQKVLDLPGRIKVDERRLTRITTHFSGRVRDLKVDFTGTPIRRGEPMATIYSPELIAAQRELLEAAKQKERNPRLYESVRQKFRFWEFTDEQVRDIENKGQVQTELEILSPVGGFVMSRNVAEEQHVNEGTVIFEVANLDRIWVVLEAYEEDLGWISVGDTFTFNTRSNPGQNYEATVSFIEPVVDSRSRTVRIRADLENSNVQLKPDMLVRATLTAEMNSEKLLVPTSSVLWTGKRSLVYVKDPSARVPRYEAKLVELGSRAGNFYVIEDGLTAGQEVVSNGAFRIDSEMQLADHFSMMNRQPGSGTVPVHDHGGLEMDDVEIEIEDHSQHVSGEFEKELTGLVETYLLLKEALIEENPEQAIEIAGRATDQIQAIGEHRLEGDAMKNWMQTYQHLMESLNTISEADDMEVIKAEFGSLSGELIEAVQAFGIEGEMYHQYCPMEDANWLSSEEQVYNPYMPDTMPNCGEVIERMRS